MVDTRDLNDASFDIPDLNDVGYGIPMNELWIALTENANATTFQEGVVVNIKREPTNTSLANGATLTPTHPVHVISGDYQPVTLNAALAIALGSKVGQELRLIGGSASNVVTILHNANTEMNGDITLELSEVLDLYWNGTNWIEVFRSN